MNVSLLNYITMKDNFKKDHLLLPSFEIPLKKEPPPKRFVSVYGTKATTALLSTARQQAMKDHLSLYRVDLTIDGGDLPTGRISLDNLASVKFLNLDRILADLASAMMGILLRDGDSFQGETPMKILAEEPKRFDWLWADSRFEHITTFSWNAPMTSPGPPRSLKLAITRDVSLFESIDVRNYKGGKGPLKIEFGF